MPPQRPVDGPRFLELFAASKARARSKGQRVTQKQISEALGVNEQTVSRWARGETLPSDEHVEQLRRWFAWSDEEFRRLYPDGAATREVSLADWRTYQNLPRTFPALPPVRGGAARQPLGTWMDEERHGLVEELLQRSQGLTAVITGPGHGGTTLAHMIADRLSEQVTTRSIPVLISLEDLIDEPYDELAADAQRFLARTHPRLDIGNTNPDQAWVVREAEAAAHNTFEQVSVERAQAAVTSAVSREVLASLATRPWERVMPRETMRELLGAQSSEKAELERSRLQLAVFLGLAPHAEARLEMSARDANELWGDGHALLSRISRTGHVRPRLIVDLSATPMGRQYASEDVGEHFTQSHLRAARHLAASAWRACENGGQGSTGVIVVASAWTWDHLKETVPELAETIGADRVRWPPFVSEELVAMLVRQAPHLVETRCERTLTELEAHAESPPNRALSTSAFVLEARLEAALAAAGTPWWPQEQLVELEAR